MTLECCLHGLSLVLVLIVSTPGRSGTHSGLVIYVLSFFLMGSRKDAEALQEYVM